MASFVEIPPRRLDADVLAALLQEFASRDGTDYGAREWSLEEKAAMLQSGLERGDLVILYDSDSESWDLCPREQADQWLQELP
jgi:uncharacterized protein YheU (UPF0270 family)